MHLTCFACGREFTQDISRGGRPRDYCGRHCRATAERARRNLKRRNDAERRRAERLAAFRASPVGQRTSQIANVA